MKRTPLRRSTKPIARNTPPKKKRTGTRRVSVDRNPKYLAWCHDQRCAACKQIGLIRRVGDRFPVSPAHGPNNGMSSKGPDTEAVPLCEFPGPNHHGMYDGRIKLPNGKLNARKHPGDEFEKYYRIDMRSEAKAHFVLFTLLKEVPSE